MQTILAQDDAWLKSRWLRVPASAESVRQLAELAEASVLETSDSDCSSEVGTLASWSTGDGYWVDAELAALHGEDIGPRAEEEQVSWRKTRKTEKNTENEHKLSKPRPDSESSRQILHNGVVDASILAPFIDL